MTIKNIDDRLNYLVEKNIFFAFEPSGELITVTDLLTAKLGRAVEFDEAVEYVKKKRFVSVMHNKIIKKSLTKI